MMAFHTGSPGNAAVTAFMRWPIVTTLMAAAIGVANVMPEETAGVAMEVCSKVAGQKCDRGQAAPAGTSQTSQASGTPAAKPD